MTIYDLKPAFQNLLRPLVNKLAMMGITPNQITWAALILSVVIGLLIALFEGSRWVLFLVPLALFIRMALNALDGMLAKEHDMKSDYGAILNEMGDVVSDAALYLPLALIAGVNAVAVVFFVIVGIFTEMVGVLGAAIGKERRYDGPMGKSDRAFLVGLLTLLWALGFVPGIWSDTLLFAGALLGALTVVKRAKGVL